jgi:hypothetical protein
MSDTAEKTKLHSVDALNDIVAILKIAEAPDGISIPSDELVKMSNEGVVVGVGPDATGVVELGDMVIMRPNKYMAIIPGGGEYEGYTVVLVKKLDLMVRKPNKSGKFEIV